MVNVERNNKPGIVYISRIPPTMTPHDIRSYFEPFGKITKLFLAPDEKSIKKGVASNKNPREKRKARFTEGWVEFEKRRNAKTIALALNGSKVGGKKSNRFYDEIWNVKYLKGFKWANLNEQANYERAVRQQKLHLELSQSKKANSEYMKQSDRALEMEKIAETRLMKQAKRDGIEPKLPSENEKIKEKMAVLGEKFRQRKPIL